MSQITTPVTNTPTLESYLQVHTPELIATIQAQLCEQIEFYRLQPAENVRNGISRALVPYFEALSLRDSKLMLEWIDATLDASVVQQLSLDFLLHTTSIYRAAMFDLGVDALQAGVPDAADGLRRLSLLIDDAMRAFSRIYQEQITLFRTLADYAPDGISVANPAGAIIYANPAFQKLMGYGPEIIGMPIIGLFDAEGQTRLPDIAQALAASGVWRGTLPYRRKNGSQFTGDLASYVLQNAQGQRRAHVAILRDMTAQLRMDDERQQLQTQVIEAQKAALAELSTPIIPISDRVMVMPLIGSIDSGRAQQIIERLLEGVTESHAESAIIDITGVPVVDTQVAQALLRAAQAASLVGARVVLTGIRPEVAQTLVGLGVNMADIVTRSTLQSGIAYALGHEARAM